MCEIEIERLSLRGEGVAGALRVPFTLPGERVMLDPLTVRRPAPTRVAPPCPAFGRCGGCALQHGSDAFVRSWKEGQVQTALAAHGLEVPLRDTATSPPGSRRRAQLHVRRTRKTVEIGYLARGSHTLVPLSACPVLVPGIAARLGDLARLGAFGASRQGLARVVVTQTDGGLDVDVQAAKPLRAAQEEGMVAQAQAMDLARLSVGGEVLYGARPPLVRFGDVDVTPPPGAFLQATVEGEAALRADVAEAVSGAARLADLFAGCGTFALPLARASEVLAVEGDTAALAALEAGWRGAVGLRRVVLRVRDLFHRPLLAAELKGIDAVVIDPPRAGAAAQMGEIAASDIARVAAVSCNPISFARDAAVLRGAGFRLDWVRVVDQFRWSPHIELTAQFTR